MSYFSGFWKGFVIVGAEKTTVNKKKQEGKV